MSKHKEYITSSGKLNYNDDGCYELLFSSGHVNVNLSDLLDKVYNSNNKYIKIKIMNCCKLIFEEQGNLMKYKSYDTGVFDYHINGNCLGDVLFFNTDNDLEIAIYAPSLQTGDMDSYGNEQTTRKTS